MVRTTKKISFFVSINVFRWLQENVSDLNGWGEDAFKQKIEGDKKTYFNIKKRDNSEKDQ